MPEGVAISGVYGETVAVPAHPASSTTPPMNVLMLRMPVSPAYAEPVGPAGWRSARAKYLALPPRSGGLLVTGCVSCGMSDARAGRVDKTLEERVRELEREVAALRRKIEELEETVESIFKEMRAAEEAQDIVR